MNKVYIGEYIPSSEERMMLSDRLLWILRTRGILPAAPLKDIYVSITAGRLQNNATCDFMTRTLTLGRDPGDRVL